ncbi:hypothetical protein CesoFtcFv8_009649 [Champsocephalus esox]|uniref:Uncharacterized protein n=1 Tax=Champsocephalus esox TaxID=159716 RepID=A0AAN8C3M6_9TELE|nr:hypothetical protein CesoFtcFv8_009649 [Champsocephalus esox]
MQRTEKGNTSVDKIILLTFRKVKLSNTALSNPTYNNSINSLPTSGTPAYRNNCRPLNHSERSKPTTPYTSATWQQVARSRSSPGARNPPPHVRPTYPSRPSNHSQHSHPQRKHSQRRVNRAHHGPQLATVSRTAPAHITLTAPEKSSLHSPPHLPQTVSPYRRNPTTRSGDQPPPYTPAATPTTRAPSHPPRYSRPPGSSSPTPCPTCRTSRPVVPWRSLPITRHPSPNHTTSEPRH